MRNGDGNTGKVGKGRLAVLYARSPDHTEWDRTPLDEQLAACRALADELGYAVADEAVLIDEGPGTGSARPGLTRLLGLVAEGRAAAVITHTLDRLARDGSTLQETLLRELRRRELPIYVAKVPRGYRYEPATGKLTHDPAEVAEANREDWQPPKYIVIPVDDEA